MMAIKFSTGCFRLNNFTCQTYNNSGVSISCWVRYDSDPVTPQRPWGAAQNFELRSNTEGGGGQPNWALDLYGTGGYGTTVPIVGEWYNLIAIGSDPDNFNELWINGSLELRTRAYKSETSTYLEIGGSRGLTEYLKGIMEDFRLYNRVLTQGEIETIAYLDGSDRIFDGLDLWYPFNDGPPGLSANGNFSPIDLISGTKNLITRGSVPVYAEGIIKSTRGGQR